MGKSVSRSGTRRAVRLLAAAGVIFAGGATVGRTTAAFSDIRPLSAAASAGTVALDTGGLQRLEFSGADLAAIGPGASFSQTLTVLNQSTVTVPTNQTEIALYASLGSTPLASDSLAAVLRLRITRSVGGGTGTVLYDGTVAALAGLDRFSAPIGTTWRSINGSGSSGATAASARYVFELSLPASATSGAGSSVSLTLLFEARNITA